VEAANAPHETTTVEGDENDPPKMPQTPELASQVETHSFALPTMSKFPRRVHRAALPTRRDQTIRRYPFIIRENLSVNTGSAAIFAAHACATCP